MQDERDPLGVPHSPLVKPELRTKEHLPWCKKFGSVMKRMPLNSMMHVAFPTHRSFPPNGVFTGIESDLANLVRGSSGSESSKQGSLVGGSVSVKLAADMLPGQRRRG